VLSVSTSNSACANIAPPLQAQYCSSGCPANNVLDYAWTVPKKGATAAPSSGATAAQDDVIVFHMSVAERHRHTVTARFFGSQPWCVFPALSAHSACAVLTLTDSPNAKRNKYQKVLARVLGLARQQFTQTLARINATPQQVPQCAPSFFRVDKN